MDAPSVVAFAPFAPSAVGLVAWRSYSGGRSGGPIGSRVSPGAFRRGLDGPRRCTWLTFMDWGEATVTDSPPSLMDISVHGGPARGAHFKRIPN